MYVNEKPANGSYVRKDFHDDCIDALEKSYYSHCAEIRSLEDQLEYKDFEINRLNKQVRRLQDQLDDYLLQLINAPSKN